VSRSALARRLTTALAIIAGAASLAACGGSVARTLTVTTTVTAPSGPLLPGTGRPAVTIGDKNFTEQFILGELYYLALKAQGYAVTLNRNIGPTEVTMQALRTGSLEMYPEYLDVWNTTIAGDHHRYRTRLAAFEAAERYALAHGFRLLNPTPFSDTSALAVGFNYSVQHSVVSITDLRRVADSLTLGAPPQFASAPDGLPAIRQAYGVQPAAFRPLDVGAQYQALDAGSVQVADVDTTDGQLITGNYTLLADPRRVFGYGNVIPVVPLRVLAVEGPQFAATLNRVSALLTIGTIRQLNAAVDVDNEDPASVAQQFLEAHGLIPGPG
jgi:osmoprotectant transport system substrate-binding protein